MFGNPGSTELPMLQDFPDDFRYVLGLQEAVVVGMADGYAQASGGPALVNLHTAPGRRQCDGRDLQRTGKPFAAGDHRRPAVAVADHLAGQPDQPRRDADAPPAGQVELRAGRGPRTCRWRLRAQRTWRRCRRRARRSSRSRWTTGTPRSTRPMRAPRSSARRAAAPAPTPRRSPISPADSSRRRTRCWSPAPTSTAAVPGMLAVALAERQNLPVFSIPATGGGRLGFPEGHPNFRGILPPAIGPLSETLAGRDLILVVGSSVFPYYPNLPGPLLPEGASLVAITSDPDEAARAPMGDAIVADVRLTLERLLDAVGESDRDPGESLPEPSSGPERGSDHRHGGDERARRRLSRRWHRRARGAVFDPGAAKPAADLEAGQLLLRRRRRARLRALGRGRGPARRARPPGCLRRRRGLGAVRGHRLLERRRLRRAGDLPRSAKQRVRDPQVVRGDRGGRGRSRARPPRPRHRRGRRRLRRQHAASERRRRAARGACHGDRRRGPELVEVGVGPGMWLF